MMLRHVDEVHCCSIKGTPWGLEYTFSSALFVTTRPIRILVFDTYTPRYICNCLLCSLIAFSASWSRSMCKFQQFPFEIARSQGVPLIQACIGGECMLLVLGLSVVLLCPVQRTCRCLLLDKGHLFGCPVFWANHPWHGFHAIQ